MPQNPVLPIATRPSAGSVTLSAVGVALLSGYSVVSFIEAPSPSSCVSDQAGISSVGQR